jgi:hypothetical protein
MPPLVSHHRWPGESLLHADAHQGLLLCYDAGPHLLRIWWSLSCTGSFLPGRGSWIAKKVPHHVGGGVAAFAHAHEVVHSECDASRARVDAAQLDFFTNARASSSQYKYLTDLGRTVEECQILLCM